MYIIYHPDTKTAASIPTWSDKYDFGEIGNGKFCPELYASEAAAKASVSRAINLIKMRYRGHEEERRLSDLKSFIMGIQIIKINLIFEKPVFEYLFNIDKII